MGRHPTLELLAVFSHCSAKHYLAVATCQECSYVNKCIMHKHTKHTHGQGRRCFAEYNTAREAGGGRRFLRLSVCAKLPCAGDNRSTCRRFPALTTFDAALVTFTRHFSEDHRGGKPQANHSALNSRRSPSISSYLPPKALQNGWRR